MATASKRATFSGLDARRMARNYKREDLKKRTTSHADVEVGSCLIVGLLVEQALKLQFSPPRGSLPILLSDQTREHPEVSISRVLVGGSARVSNGVRVKAYPKDAELALQVAKQIASKLEGPLLQLDILVADHVNNACLVHGHVVPHDLIAKFRSGAQGRGLVSVEIKLREVKNRKPTRFNWQDTLESEARALWDAELTINKESWHSRVLVFAEFGPSCHSPTGLQGLHVSRLKKAGSWETLYGWVGFRPRGGDGGPQRSPAQPSVNLAAHVTALRRQPKTMPRLDYRRVGGKMVAPVKNVLKTPQQPGRACKKLLAKRPRVLVEAELFETPRQNVPPGGRKEWVGTAKAIQLLFAHESA